MSIRSLKIRKSSSLNVLTIAGVHPYQQQIDEEYMNISQLLHFGRILKSWKNQLIKDIECSAFRMKSAGSINFPDPVDRAVQEEEFNIELRNRDRERKLIKKIDETLNKINIKDFGYCTVCGIEIGIRRLEANPIADLCVDCKTLEEIKEKQMTG